ncbi:MAG: molybdopterin-dependent oxidoreductase [Acidimicrobiia bacterium]|nr:molybdopterin-dependent oxidoreductase [Acidimicrobiia bacterium]
MSDGFARTNEESYRQRWTWDGVGWGTHCVDCYPGNCPYRVYTRDGKVWREEPSGDFGTVEAGVPDMNPAGCNKGAAWSRQLENPDRLRYPMRRVGERGGGEWERITWDEALTMLADSIIATIEEHGPECVMHEGSRSRRPSCRHTASSTSSAGPSRTSTRLPTTSTSVCR